MVGLIGLGRMGLTHFSILNTHPAVRIASVCDQSHTMLQIAGKYLSLRTYKDHEEMLDNEALDCVVISTPGDSHGAIIQACLKKGLHVFVEKPFAMNGLEGQAVLSEMGERPLVNQVGYVNRFNEVFMAVRQLIADGLIGKVLNFSSEMFGPTVVKDSKPSWRGQGKTGGGCMYEFASHCIDLVIYLLGRPDRVAGSILQSIYSSEVEDLVSSTFIYNKGFSGNVIANWSDETSRKPTNIVKITGTRGKIIADKHAYKIYLREGNAKNGFTKGWNTRYITDFANPVRFYVRGNEFTRQLDYFIERIERKETDNLASFSEGHKTDLIMEEVRKDAAGVPSQATGKSLGLVNPRLAGKPSFWKRLLGRKEPKYA